MEHSAGRSRRASWLPVWTNTSSAYPTRAAALLPLRNRGVCASSDSRRLGTTVLVRFGVGRAVCAGRRSERSGVRLPRPLGRHTLNKRPMVTSRSACDHDLLESVETARGRPRRAGNRRVSRVQSRILASTMRRQADDLVRLQGNAVGRGAKSDGHASCFGGMRTSAIRSPDVAANVATLTRRRRHAPLRTGKATALQGLSMRRRGLEPPPTKCGPGPQPGNPDVI